MSELTLTHQATGAENVGEGLKGRAASYVKQRLAEIEESDLYSNDEKQLARMASEWTQGRNQDSVAATAAWRMIRDKAENTEANHLQVDPELKQVVTDLKPYFVTSYRSS